MGNITVIGFRPGKSLLHRLDPRTKQFFIVVLSLASLTGSVSFLGAATLVLVFLVYATGLRLLRILYEIRFFLFFLAMVFVVRTITFTGEWMVAVSSPAVIGDAVVVCWRLLLVVFMCLLLMATTRIADMRAALIWILRPLPLVNENVAATMVGLLVRFLPLILLQAGETGEALKARGIEKQKNPVKRLTRLTIPLFRRVFLRADELVDTMQARCYSEHRTTPRLRFHQLDLVAAGGVFVMCLTVFFP
ncbi:energy-coupling factor transporter transmembrane component T family protein [Desulforhopalus singaporensis]|uniref:Biotin transport system permease protein n=1 Tax=Desulforhopalus singaporensis TaxID=91360 RepID=A0A1H0RWN5_9BACT|nr:energy-coupling factor transporter transmembrane component T [Desulforhopalus singaporensis]SDP33817.1 biotin transport system permease protein [Desulforhopalus singaporensis]